MYDTGGSALGRCIHSGMVGKIRGGLIYRKDLFTKYYQANRCSYLGDE